MTNKSSPFPESNAITNDLAERLDSQHLKQRLGRERRRERNYQQECLQQGWIALKNKLLSRRWQIRQVLRWTLLEKRGQRNALDLQLAHNTIKIPASSAGLDGLTILHLSDLHIECIEGLADVLAARVAPLHPDITVITGDIRSRSFGPKEPSLKLMRQIREQLNSDCYAVLGNHDSIQMVPALEEMGIRVLLNESVSLDFNGHSFTLAGVDDPSDYHCDDIPGAITGVDENQLKILLAHSPDCLVEAEQLGIDVYFCGHTHGGQICLPGGWALRNSSRVSWQYCSGAWLKSKMQGYTSRGIGTTIAPARFNCPPEITLHRFSYQ